MRGGLPSVSADARLWFSGSVTKKGTIRMIGSRRFATGVMALACIAAHVTAAEDTVYYVKDGTSDWTNPKNYLNNAKPGPQDIVVISNLTTVTVSSSDMESWNIVSNLKSIRPMHNKSKIIFDVAEGLELTNNASIYNPEGSINGMWGEAVKRGAGTLVFSSVDRVKNNNEVRDYKVGTLTVENGTLKLPQNTPKRELHYGNIHIESGAVLELPRFDTTQGGSMFSAINGKLTGGGTIVDTNSGDRQLRVYGKCDFSGKITGRVQLFVCGALNLLGEESTFSAVPMAWSLANSAPGVIGVKKFGMKADAASSIGLADIFAIDYRGGGYKYLGEGGETTDKELKITATTENPASMDGGVHGGLTFTGSWYMNGTPSQMHVLELCGENPQACVLANDIADWNSGENHYSFQIVKYGSGIWRFADCNSRSWSGSLNVREGTVQFESLAEAGKLCSLGTATNAFLPSMVETTRSDSAITLGGLAKSGEMASGTLEYVGSGRVASSTRHIALDGLGGTIKGSASGELAISGVGALGSGSRTLTLDAAQGTTNYLQNLDEGDSKISLAKTGGGTWVLQGTQSFSGDLTVSNGTLEVKDAGDDYTWFRLVVKRVAGNHNYFNAVELALYDEQGTQQFFDPVRMEPVPRSSNTWVWCEGDYRSLKPGQVSFGKAGWYKNQWYSPSDFRDFQVLFNRVAAGSQPSAEIYYGGAGESAAARNLDPDNPDTWLHIVMRLPENANRIVAYDMMTSSTYGRERRPSVFTFEGSRDGVFWTTLHEVSWGKGVIGGDDVSNGEYQWMSDGSTTVWTSSSQNKRPGCGWRLAAPPASGSRMENIGKVTVAAGAVLKGEGECTISSLCIDAANGAGTIDGFKLAKAGTIEIVNYEKSAGTVDFGIVFSNVEGVANVAGWTLVGENLVSRKILARDGRLCLAVSGLSVVLR